MSKKECYQHIAKYWKPEYYKKCKQEWNNVKQFILSDTISVGYLCPCGVRWAEKKFISQLYGICGACDTHSQPYLSNPRNKEYVLKYIPLEYHHLILNDVQTG